MFLFTKSTEKNAGNTPTCWAPGPFTAKILSIKIMGIEAHMSFTCEFSGSKWILQGGWAPISFFKGVK